MGLTPMCLHTTLAATYIYTFTMAPLTLPSIIPRCYSIDGAVNELGYFELARKTNDARPLLHFVRYGIRLTLGYAMLSVP